MRLGKPVVVFLMPVTEAVLGPVPGWAQDGATKSPQGTTPVLFVGNSFTSVNNLHVMVEQMSRGAGHPLTVGSVVQGGYTPQNHLDGSEVVKALHDRRRDVVVLQEQSLIPSLPPEERSQRMDPAALRLHSMIRDTGARTVLYQTWGYRDGDKKDHPDDTYEAMQGRLVQGYREVGRKILPAVVPVGEAWYCAHARHPALSLWAEDGRHPGVNGTYLAACVIDPMTTWEAGR